MDIRPILSTLLRHKTAAALIVVEIALACAIITNALFIVSQRMENMRLPSGVDEELLVQIQVSGVGEQTNPDARTTEDLAALRAIPGVEEASIVNQLPFLSSSSSTSGLSLSPEQERPTVIGSQYNAGSGLLRTFGLKLIAGRDFNEDEYLVGSELRKMTDFSRLRSAVILNRAIADRLFPGQSAVGKVIYDGPVAMTVVGVVEALARPSWTEGDLIHSYLIPVKRHFNNGSYVLRVSTPDRRQQVIKDAVAALDRVDSGRMLLASKTYEEIRHGFFRSDRAMVSLLLTVCIALLVVTALGIVGLASFWVQQRTKQIGIRRALGATRVQILRYFQLENFLLATTGILLGMLLAYGINQLLMGRYELPRLPLIYLPVGAVALWLLGQVAVYGPARRAAMVPPAVATRSV